MTSLHCLGFPFTQKPERTFLHKFKPCICQQACTQVLCQVIQYFILCICQVIQQYIHYVFKISTIIFTNINQASLRTKEQSGETGSANSPLALNQSTPLISDVSSGGSSNTHCAHHNQLKSSRSNFMLLLCYSRRRKFSFQESPAPPGKVNCVYSKEKPTLVYCTSCKEYRVKHFNENKIGKSRFPSTPNKCFHIISNELSQEKRQGGREHRW